MMSRTRITQSATGVSVGDAATPSLVCGAEGRENSDDAFEPPVPNMSSDILHSEASMRCVFTLSRGAFEALRGKRHAGDATRRGAGFLGFCDDRAVSLPSPNDDTDDSFFVIIPSLAELRSGGRVRSSQCATLASWLLECLDDIVQHEMLGSRTLPAEEIGALLVVAFVRVGDATCMDDANREQWQPDGRKRRRSSTKGGKQEHRAVRLAGLCIARERSIAYRIRSTNDGLTTDTEQELSSPTRVDDSMDHDRWTRTTSELSDSVLRGSSICGVDLVWVASCCRRQGIASRMVDVARRHLVYGGFEIPKHAVAFSAPTRDGKTFAASYSGRRDFYSYEVQ